MDEVSGRVGANASAMPIPERKTKISKYTLLRWRVIRDVTCRRRMARTLPRIPTRNLGLGLALHDSGLLGSSCSVSGRKTNYLAAEQETEECCRFGIGNPSLRHALRGGASSFFSLKKLETLYTQPGQTKTDIPGSIPLPKEWKPLLQTCVTRVCT